MSETKQPIEMPELAPHLKMRQRFFAQEMPEGYADEWAAVLAQPLAVEPETKDSMLEFRLGELQLAIAARYVKSVTDTLTVCPVPHRNNTAFLGLVAFSGEVIPCVSLARILGAADAIAASDARTIVLEERPGERWAFRVHAVFGVSRGSVHERTAEDGNRLSKDWTDSVFEDERKQRIDILKPKALFQRLRQATA